MRTGDDTRAAPACCGSGWRAGLGRAGTQHREAVWHDGGAAFHGRGGRLEQRVGHSLPLIKCALLCKTALVQLMMTMRPLQFLTPYKFELPVKPEYQVTESDGFSIIATNDVVDEAAGTRSLKLQVSNPGIIWPGTHPLLSPLPQKMNAPLHSVQRSPSTHTSSNGRWTTTRRTSTRGITSRSARSTGTTPGRSTLS